MLLSRIIVFVVCGQILLAPVAQAFDCVTTQQLRVINPEIESPILFWKGPVLSEVRLAVVKMPHSEEILVNIQECKSAQLRKIEDGDVLDPSRASGDARSPSYRCEPLGDLWLPLANRVENGFDPKDETDFFVLQIKKNLEDKADELAWDPYLQSTIDSLNHIMFASVGFGLYRLASKYYVPKTRWQKVKKMGYRGLGILFMLQAGFAIYRGAESNFTEEMNQRSEEIEDLVSKIDARVALRLDGQDESAYLDESDGYSILINAIKKANQTTLQKFCN